MREPEGPPPPSPDLRERPPPLPVPNTMVSKYTQGCPEHNLNCSPDSYRDALTERSSLTHYLNHSCIMFIVTQWPKCNLRVDTVVEGKLAFKLVKTTGHCSTVHGKFLIVLDFLVTTTSTDTSASKGTLNLYPLSIAW